MRLIAFEWFDSQDPVKRISWEKLRVHAFWTAHEFPLFQIPSQPHFENYLKLKGISSQNLAQNKEKEEKEIGTPTLTTGQKIMSAPVSNNSSTIILGKKPSNPNNIQETPTTQKAGSNIGNAGLNDVNKKNVNVTRYWLDN